jgi:hypothetical protein
MQRQIYILFLAAFTFANCSSGQNSSGPIYSVPDSMSQGFLDLGVMYQAFNSLPDSLSARQFTQNETAADTNARPELLMQLYKGGFIFEDLPVKQSDLLKDYTGASQKGCKVGEKVQLTTPDGDSDNYIIKNCTPNSIEIQSSTSEDFVYQYELIDSQTLRLTKRYQAIDTCFNESRARPRQNVDFETTRIVRWGLQNEIQKPEELVSAEMLRRIAEGVDSEPDLLLRVGSTDGLVPVSSADLRSLFQARLRSDVEICPGLYARPSPGATPAPEPTPVATPPPGTEPNPELDPTPSPYVSSIQ